MDGDRKMVAITDSGPHLQSGSAAKSVVMASAGRQPSAGGRNRRRLSTGHVIALPLELSFTMGGVIVPARRERLESTLPDALSSLAIAPGIGCVTLVGIQYHRVGGDGRPAAASNADQSDLGLDPYDEFAVIIPAVSGSRTTLPFVRLVRGEVGGYVHWLPVSTDASVALGRECWGYPKERATVTVTDGPRGVRTVVGRDSHMGELRLEVSRPRSSVPIREQTLSSFTARDGELVRARMQLRGEVSIGPPVGSTLEVSPDLESELGLWQRPLARLTGSRLRARLFEGERPSR